MAKGEWPRETTKEAEEKQGVNLGEVFYRELMVRSDYNECYYNSTWNGSDMASLEEEKRVWESDYRDCVEAGIVTSPRDYKRKLQAVYAGCLKAEQKHFAGLLGFHSDRSI